MNNSPRRLDAGLVYYFAIALHRRSPRHTAIKEAAHWLRKHGYSRQALQLDQTFEMQEVS